MELQENIYSYNFELANFLDLTTNINLLVIAGCILLATVAVVFITPYVYGYSLYRKQEWARFEKKQTLANLRIMNEIQSELEAEMKQSSLQSSLQNIAKMS